MADLPRFKILSLTSLTYEAIVQKMNVREQYKLATLSKRMQRGVCKSNRIGVVSCFVSFGDDDLFFLVTHEFTRSIFKYRFRSIEGDKYFSLAKDQIEFLKNSLRLQTVDLSFSEDHPAKIEFALIPFLKQEELKIRDITSFSNGPTNDALCEYLLNEGKDCRELELHLDCSPNFRPSQCPVLNVDVFHSLHAGWVTVDHLVANFMNCKKIDLDLSQFTPQQLNPFIKKWIEGSRIELAFLELTDDSQFESIVNGIDSTEIRQAYTPACDHFVLSLGRHSFEPNECFLIEQASGVKALLYVKLKYVFLRTKFSLDAELVVNHDVTPIYKYDDDEESEDGEDEESDEEDDELDDEEADESEDEDEEDSDVEDEELDGEDEEEGEESDE